jgi:hypothetical protein
LSAKRFDGEAELVDDVRGAVDGAASHDFEFGRSIERRTEGRHHAIVRHCVERLRVEQDPVHVEQDGPGGKVEKHESCLLKQQREPKLYLPPVAS